MGEKTEIHDLQHLDHPELLFDKDGFMEGLVPEFRDVALRLQQTAKGRVALNEDDFRELMVRNSFRIDETEASLSAPGVKPSDFSIDELETMYKLYTPLIDMRTRVHILDFLGEGILLRAEELKADPDPKKPARGLLKQRLAACIYEEIGSIDASRSESAYLVAEELNREIAESDPSLLDTSTSPRKLHAKFSIADIQARKLHAKGRQYSTDPFRQELAAIQIQRKELILEMALRARRSIANEAISGAIGELQLIISGTDFCMTNGSLDERSYLFTQTPLRRDSNDLTPLGLPPSTYWYWSHDVELTNSEIGRVLPIEAKKVKGGNYSVSPSSYLPLIDVFAYRLGDTTDDFFRLTVAIAKADLEGRDPREFAQSEQDAEKIERFNTRMNRELKRIFSKAATHEEFATNYFDARKPLPGDKPINTVNNTSD